MGIDRQEGGGPPFVPQAAEKFVHPLISHTLFPHGGEKVFVSFVSGTCRRRMRLWPDSTPGGTLVYESGLSTTRGTCLTFRALCLLGALKRY